ncbi:myosin heavy chain, muscle-like [Penaeus monodon]|uniref:myosin heavy chain, muscle-like n=1 Tax=Penaeus monodon TaxID=6687 RepID=UPI0018A6F84A|nr:myosin heavy chain, muscle-like [Penaeus monodon]
MPGHVVKSTGPDPDPSEFLFVSTEQRMLDQTKPYDPKKSCWVPDDKEGFLEGMIQATKSDTVLSIQLKSGEVKDYKKDVVSQVNPPKYEKCEDMSNLTFLNDASVLYNLKPRYQARLIYTYSGLFCIAVNPYKRFPIYTNRTVKIYQGKRRNECLPISSPFPTAPTWTCCRLLICVRYKKDYPRNSITFSASVNQSMLIT